MISGAADPRLHLSRIAAGADDLDGAIYWLEEHVKVTYEDLKARKQLVGWYRLRKDSVNMRRHLVAMINVYPLDRSVHVGLGDVYLELEGKGDEAVTEFEVALSLQQLEPEQDRSVAEEATIRVSLGRAHMLGENGLDEAETQAKHALELVPDHAAARTLLRAVQAARQRNGDKE
jgi:tetratricopeptide (TPR) repeat protein